VKLIPLWDSSSVVRPKGGLAYGNDTPSTLAQTFNPLSIDLEPGEIPTLEDFGHQHFEPDPRAVLNFKGGETEGLKRLKYYLWETDFIKEYKESRNGMLGGDYSSKFSPWLAQGCISPKMVYHELKKYEQERGANESTYWLFFELLWRDFFRFMGKKYSDVSSELKTISYSV
jgi:deoxyribodipyrimidine photo-lyase